MQKLNIDVGELTAQCAELQDAIQEAVKSGNLDHMLQISLEAQWMLLKMVPMFAYLLSEGKFMSNNTSYSKDASQSPDDP